MPCVNSSFSVNSVYFSSMAAVLNLSVLTRAVAAYQANCSTVAPKP